MHGCYSNIVQWFPIVWSNYLDNENYHNNDNCIDANHDNHVIVLHVCMLLCICTFVLF